MAITSIRFEAIGDHIDVKIGSHCRASLSVLEEQMLLGWLLDRENERDDAARPSGVLPTPHYLELPASRATT